MASPGSPDLLRRRLLMAAAALPAACASPLPSLAPPATPPPPPRVTIGDRWHYETIDLYRGARVGELSAEVIRGAAAPLVVALTDQRGAPLGQSVWSRPWDVIVELAYDVPQTFEKPMPLLPDLLVPGARRSDATYYSVPNSSSRLYWRQSLRATGWERIEVPAGGFDALRVERYINFAHWDSWRELPWRIDTLWYAPLVERWVQREWTGRYRWPGGRQLVEADEDRIRWRLLDWHRAGA